MRSSRGSVSGWDSFEDFFARAVPSVAMRFTSWKHDIALRGIAAEHGFHYLPGSPLIIGAVGFAGSLGWYDYSLRDPRLDGAIGRHQYEEGTFNRLQWVYRSLER